MGISGKERADSAAKAALQKDVSDCLISYTDAYQYIRDLWQSEWDTVNNLQASVFNLHAFMSDAPVGMSWQLPDYYIFGLFICFVIPNYVFSTIKCFLTNLSLATCNYGIPCF